MSSSLPSEILLDDENQLEELRATGEDFLDLIIGAMMRPCKIDDGNYAIMVHFNDGSETLYSESQEYVDTWDSAADAQRYIDEQILPEIAISCSNAD